MYREYENGKNYHTMLAKFSFGYGWYNGTVVYDENWNGPIDFGLYSSGCSELRDDLEGIVFPDGSRLTLLESDSDFVCRLIDSDGNEVEAVEPFRIDGCVHWKFGETLGWDWTYEEW